MDFKYKVSFSSDVKTSSIFGGGEQLCTASLLELAKYLPENVKPEINQDLLPVSFNAAVGNQVNKNDDGCDAKTLVEMARYFINKPINLEHKRSVIRGTILGYAFTQFGSNLPLSEEEAKTTKEPFNLTLSGVIWRIVDKEFASYLEDCSNPDSPSFEECSASWEVAFSENNLILLPKDKTYYKDGLIVTSEDKDYKKISEHLRSNGGNGSWGEFRVCRDIILPALPLGIGITENPAGSVKGIVTMLNKVISAETEDHSEDCDCEDCEVNSNKKIGKIVVSEEKSETWICPHCNEKIKEKSLSNWDEVNRASQHTCGRWVIHPELSEAEKAFLKTLADCGEKMKHDNLSNEDKECECELPESTEEHGKQHCVRCGKKMKDSIAQLADINKTFTTVSIDLTNSLTEISKNPQTESISTVINNKKPNKIMLTAIADINDEYLKTAQAAEIREFLEKCAAESATKAAEQLKAAEAEKGSVAADLEKAKVELEAAKAELEKLNQEKSAAAAQELFNKRMSHFDEKFELCEDAKKAIVARIRDIKDDESFAAYQKEMDIFLKGKEKGQKQVVASVQNDDKALDNALKNAEAQKIEITSTPIKDEPKSFYEKYRKAFEINSENYKSR